MCVLTPAHTCEAPALGIPEIRAGQRRLESGAAGARVSRAKPQGASDESRRQLGAPASRRCGGSRGGRRVRRMGAVSAWGPLAAPGGGERRAPAGLVVNGAACESRSVRPVRLQCSEAGGVYWAGGRVSVQWGRASVLQERGTETGNVFRAKYS